MTNSIIQEVYASPNGDKWALARNGEGELVVYHRPSPASGGFFWEMGVIFFLEERRPKKISFYRRIWRS